jgi:hypothetical protein
VEGPEGRKSICLISPHFPMIGWREAECSGSHFLKILLSQGTESFLGYFGSLLQLREARVPRFEAGLQ